jgi:hypothetical protein
MGERTGPSCAVTLTAFGVFLLAAGGILQAVLALVRSAQISRLPLSVPGWYFFGGSLIWGCLYLVSGWGILKRRVWGFRLALLTLLLQFIAWIADALWIRHPDTVSQSIGFDAAVRVLLVAVGAFLLVRLGRPPSKIKSG